MIRYNSLSECLVSSRNNISRYSISTRAALLEGSLVWPIALLYLSDSMLEVTRGPSLDAALLGKHWKLAGGSILYDDRLSDAEIDVICSVYKIATGELSDSDINARTNNSLHVWDHKIGRAHV